MIDAEGLSLGLCRVSQVFPQRATAPCCTGAAFGKVLEGMEVVDAIAETQTNSADSGRLAGTLQTKGRHAHGNARDS